MNIESVFIKVCCAAALSTQVACGSAGRRGDIAAAKCEPAKSMLTVEGTLTVGHEVRGFVAEGDTLDYWVVDATDKLLPMYDSLTGGVKNGKPVHARLRVVDEGKADDGFAESYDGVYRVVGIESMALIGE